MKIIKFLGLFTGILANINLNALLTKIDYKLILSLYLGENQSFYDMICLFMTIWIKILTGVNLYNLEESLRIFGVM